MIVATFISVFPDADRPPALIADYALAAAGANDATPLMTPARVLL